MAEGPISSEEFTKKLNEFNEQQKRQRHESHTRVMSALIEQGKETTAVHDRIDRMELTIHNVSMELKSFIDSMHPFAELADDLKGRLVGNPSMKTGGLIDDHESLKKTIDERLKNIEITAKNNGEVATKTRKEQTVAIWAFAGTLITTIGVMVSAYLSLRK